jgi:hemoglobin
VENDLYQAVGGIEVCRQLSEAFYSRVKRDPVLRPFFPGKSLRCAIEAFTAFLAQFLGGPAEHADRRWWLSLRESHARFRIGEREREAWMKNMAAALNDVSLDDPMREALRSLFERSSAYVVNHGQAPAVSQAIGHDEISHRWDAQLALDEAVGAVRRGDAGRAIALAESSALQAHFRGNRSVFAALLARMIASHQGVLIDYACQRLSDDPALAKARYSGRTLLHGAAAAGNVATVELLLALGADPQIRDTGGHTPLYSVANECQTPGGGDVVRALVSAGADVDADDGVKRCSPLHMAARRGNIEIAAALLDCGADIDRKDKLGVTPLQRAINCRKRDVAEFLRRKDADRHRSTTP